MSSEQASTSSSARIDRREGCATSATRSSPTDVPITAGATTPSAPASTTAPDAEKGGEGGASEAGPSSETGAAYINGGNALASSARASGESWGGAEDGATEANEAGGGRGVGVDMLETEASDSAVRLDPDGRDDGAGRFVCPNGSEPSDASSPTITSIQASSKSSSRR